LLSDCYLSSRVRPERFRPEWDLSPDPAIELSTSNTEITVNVSPTLVPNSACARTSLQSKEISSA